MSKDKIRIEDGMLKITFTEGGRKKKYWITAKELVDSIDYIKESKKKSEVGFKNNKHE